MKKTAITLSLLSLVLLTACGSGEQWDYSDPNMPEEVKQGHEESLNGFLQDLKEAPNDSNILVEVALQYQHLGQYKEAVDYYEQTLEKDPRHLVALNNLAAIHEEMGNYEEASEYIMKLFEQRPESLEALRDVVRILLLADDPENAQVALEYFNGNLAPEDYDEEMQLFISELYEEIFDYKSQNGPTQ